MGVVWGEGVADQRGSATGSGISGWVERLFRTMWRRLFMHGGEG